MDPVIPEDILLTIAIIVIGGPIAWLAWRWAWRWLVAGAVEARERLMKATRARTRATVTDDCGVNPNETEHGLAIARERAVPHIGAPVVAQADEWAPPLLPLRRLLPHTPPQAGGSRRLFQWKTRHRIGVDDALNERGESL